MTNTKRLISVLLVLVCGVMLTGCARTVDSMIPVEIWKEISTEQEIYGKKVRSTDNNKLMPMLEEHPELINTGIPTVAIESDENWNPVYTPGYTPLSWFASGGQNENVKYLISKGADVNLKNSLSLQYPPDRGATALHAAARNLHTETAKILIDNGANVNAKSMEGKTALHLAVKNYKIIELTAKKDDPGLENNDDDVELTKLLITKGANVNIKDKEGNAPIYSVIRGIFVRDPGEKNRGNMKTSPNAKEIAKLLIENGADVKNVSGSDKTLLHMAVEKGWYEFVEVLIKKGVKVNARNNRGGAIYINEGFSSEGFTALHYAIFRNHKEIVELLIANGANVNTKNTQGYTPLHLAAKRKIKEIVELLIENGADVNTRNRDGKTPLAIAVEKENRKTADLLRKHGAVE